MECVGRISVLELSSLETVACRLVGLSGVNFLSLCFPRLRLFVFRVRFQPILHKLLSNPLALPEPVIELACGWSTFTCHFG